MTEEQATEEVVAEGEEAEEEPNKIEFKVAVTTAAKWWNDKVVDEEGNETTVENESLATTSCSVDLLGLHSAESEAVALLAKVCARGCVALRASARACGTRCARVWRVRFCWRLRAG